MFGVHICNIDSMSHWICVINFYFIQQFTGKAVLVLHVITRVVLKVMSSHFLHANREQQTKESIVVDGTSCCIILECLVMSVACIT